MTVPRLKKLPLETAIIEPYRRRESFGEEEEEITRSRIMTTACALKSPTRHVMRYTLAFVSMGIVQALLLLMANAFLFMAAPLLWPMVGSVAVTCRFWSVLRQDFHTSSILAAAAVICIWATLWLVGAFMAYRLCAWYYRYLICLYAASFVGGALVLASTDF